jgi:hypothetical protein
VDTGSHGNQVYADCVDLSAAEKRVKTRIWSFGSDSIRTDEARLGVGEHASLVQKRQMVW